jgi:hypothetical protein
MAATPMAEKPVKGITYEALKRLGLALPEVRESTSYGTPALKLRGKLLARLREDELTVVLRTTWEEREQWMTVHPKAFHLTDHYRNGPWVLLHLPAATPQLAQAALRQAWRATAPARLLAQHSP